MREKIQLEHQFIRQERKAQRKRNTVTTLQLQKEWQQEITTFHNHMKLQKQEYDDKLKNSNHEIVKLKRENQNQIDRLKEHYHNNIIYSYNYINNSCNNNNNSSSSSNNNNSNKKKQNNNKQNNSNHIIFYSSNNNNNNNSNYDHNNHYQNSNYINSISSNNSNHRSIRYISYSNNNSSSSSFRY